MSFFFYFEYILQHTVISYVTDGYTFIRQHFEIVFLFFSESGICHLIQVVSSGDTFHEIVKFYGDNLHEMPNPIFWEK